MFEVAAWSNSSRTPFGYALSSYPISQGWMLWTRFFFLMEMMVYHVSKRIQFGLMLLMVGSSFLVWVMVSPTFSDCDPVQVLAVYGGKFPE